MGSNNRADSRLNLKGLTEFKPIHVTPSFHPSVFPPYLKIRRPYRSSVILCPFRAYYIFKNRSTTDIEMLRIYKSTYLWVIHNAALPSFITELSIATNSLVQDYRNSFKLPIRHSYWFTPTRKYSGVYSVQ